MQIPLGRVVGSKIRNGETMPTNFTGWLDGDIFILNDGNLGFPYYEYTNKVLELRGKLQGGTGPIVDRILPKEEAELNAASNSSLSAKQGYILQTRIDTNRANHNILKEKVNKQYDTNTKYEFSLENEQLVITPNNINKNDYTVNINGINLYNNEEMYNSNFTIYNTPGEVIYDGTWKISNGWKYYLIIDSEGRVCFSCFQPAIYGANLLIPTFDDYDRNEYYNTNDNPCFQMTSETGTVKHNIVVPEGGYLILGNQGDRNKQEHDVFLTNLNNLISYLTNGTYNSISTEINKNSCISEYALFDLNDTQDVLKIFKDEIQKISLPKMYIHHMKVQFNEGSIFVSIPSHSNKQYTMNDFLNYFPINCDVNVSGSYSEQDVIENSVVLSLNKVNNEKFIATLAIYDETTGEITSDNNFYMTPLVVISDNITTI